jgi:vacuolar-type H+-ATPase subunit I/STV1
MTSVGNVMTSKRESLLQEITELNEHIQLLRKSRKNTSAEVKKLIELIIELDGLEQDKEFKDS